MKKQEITFTIDSFLKNPTGQMGEATSKRKLVLDAYRLKLQNMIRNKKRFKTFGYEVGNAYYIKVQVPSESFDDLWYDVIVKFLDVEKDQMTIQSNSIQFISNCPSFVFTYGYVFTHNSLLITELESKIGKKAVNDAPVVRNPDYDMFYEKSITLALLYIERNGLTNRLHLKDSTFKMPLSKFVSGSMQTHAAIMKQYAECKRAEKAKRETFKKTKAENKKTGLSGKGSDIKASKLKTDLSSSNRVSMKVDNKVKSKVSNKVNMKVDNTVKRR